jgi:hypothetical protein
MFVVAMEECSTDLHSNRKVVVRRLSDADQGRRNRETGPPYALG